MWNDSIASLKRVLEAAATVPGNRQRFLEAGLIEASRSTERLQLSSDWQNAFSQLRAIDKQTVRESPGLFLANTHDIVYRGTTSGSRGQSFIYFAGREWNEARMRARRQSLEWWGIGENTPIINVASRLLPVRAIDRAIAGVPDRDFIHLLLSAIASSPAAIRGYPSRLCEVAARLPRGRETRAIAVICTGECLFGYQRQLLEDVFCAPVIEEYGCQETGISGFTCPEAGQLHLDRDRCLYEIVDGQLVTTDLLNCIMPIVRYKSGDLIEFNTQPCPCGRPGPTGKILGRREDRVRTLDGIKYPGEITMPPLEGILNYQVLRRQGARIDLSIQTANSNDLSLEPIVTWMQATFGEVDAQILWDNSPETNTTGDRRTCEDAEWIDRITSEGWNNWLKEPVFPDGALSKAAQFLHQAIAPAILLGSGLPPTTEALLYEILDSPPCKAPKVELMRARVLIFSCSFFCADPILAESIYSRAAERLQSALELLCEMKTAAIVDLLIPSLFLNTPTAQFIWTQTNYPLECTLDTFNVYHLLYAFEAAWRRAIASGSKLGRELQPIVSILIGDLNFFISRFGTWLLAHWCELVHGQPVAQFNPLEAIKSNNFLTGWLTLRQQIIRGTGDNTSDLLLSLTDAARSPEEKARVYLEKGYGLLVRGEQLDPQEWLDILAENGGIMSSKMPTKDIDPIPWIPILRAIAQPLLESGKPELAYQCLVASAPPSSRISAFERIAFQVNDKQSVILDKGI